jgi:hypothetical protein
MIDWQHHPLVDHPIIYTSTQEKTCECVVLIATTDLPADRLSPLSGYAGLKYSLANATTVIGFNGFIKMLL